MFAKIGILVFIEVKKCMKPYDVDGRRKHESTCVDINKATTKGKTAYELTMRESLMFHKENASIRVLL